MCLRRPAGRGSIGSSASGSAFTAVLSHRSNRRYRHSEKFDILLREALSCSWYNQLFVHPLTDYGGDVFETGSCMNSLFGRGPTKVCLSRWALMAILAVTAQAVAVDADSGAAGRLPVPDAAAKEQATKMVKGLFAKEYARRDPESRKALADKLLAQSRAGGDPPAVRFVLLSEARELAILGDDRWKAMDAADEMVSTFAVPSSTVRQIKFDVLSEGGRLATVPGAVATALNISETALADDDFDQAGRAARLAQSRGKFAVIAVRAEMSRVDAAKQSHAAAEQATVKLKTNPDDQEAKTSIGKYLSFVKGQWPQGLPLLAQSPDPVLRNAAKRDAAMLTAGASDSPDLAASFADAGDAWWRLPSPMANRQFRQMTQSAAPCFGIAELCRR